MDLKGGTAAGTLTALVTPIVADGTSYNVAVSGMIGDGTVIATVDAGKVEDAAGNLNTAGNAELRYRDLRHGRTGRNHRPRRRPGHHDGQFAHQLHLHVHRAGDQLHRQRRGLKRQHGGRHAFGHGHPGWLATYTVAVSGMTGAGTVVASIDAGVVRDAAGNSNFA